MATGPLFKQTKPFGEDVVFRSSTTGEHDLDVYLEAAERGNRTLGDLLDDLFTEDGVLRGESAVADMEEQVAQAAASALAALQSEQLAEQHKDAAASSAQDAMDARDQVVAVNPVASVNGMVGVVVLDVDGTQEEAVFFYSGL